MKVCDQPRSRSLKCFSTSSGVNASILMDGLVQGSNSVNKDYKKKAGTGLTLLQPGLFSFILSVLLCLLDQMDV